jgi:hypothetical protein
VRRSGRRHKWPTRGSTELTRAKVAFGRAGVVVTALLKSMVMVRLRWRAR